MKQSGSSISFFWKNLDCELCKVSYPSIVNLGGRHIDLIEITKPDSDFIILEALTRENQGARSLHLISLQNKSQIKLGRGHDSDVRISDISVSRIHAIINLNQGEFYLEDHDSKFGTLIQLRKPVALLPSSNFAGRSVIQFQMKQSWSFFSACLLCCSKQNQEAQQFFQEQIKSYESENNNLHHNNLHNINILALNNQNNQLEVANVQQIGDQNNQSSNSSSSSESEKIDNEEQEDQQQEDPQQEDQSEDQIESQRPQNIQQSQQNSNQSSQVMNARPLQHGNENQNNQMHQNESELISNLGELHEYTEQEVQEFTVFSPTSVLPLYSAEQENEQEQANE